MKTKTKLTAHTASYMIVKSIIKNRGATTWLVEHDLALQGKNHTNNLIKVLMCKMVHENILWKETIPCKCCQQNSIYYYVTDEGKFKYSLIQGQPELILEEI